MTLIEPAAYSTDFSGSSAEQTEHISVYDPARVRTGEVFSLMPPGDPQHTADAVLAVVDMDIPPLRLMLGAHVLPLVLAEYDHRIRTWQAYAATTDRSQ